MSMPFEPPAYVPRDHVEAVSDRVLRQPHREVTRRHEVFRIAVLGLDWDFGVAIYEPNDPAKRLRMPSGAVAGVLLLHGGSGDFKHVEPVSRMLSERFGVTVLAGTFPGRYYFPDPDHGWPGDTIRDDGTVRTPLWQRGEEIGPDQYDIVTDGSLRDRYGTRTLAKARSGSRFERRMASWPAALEAGMMEACARWLPVDTHEVLGAGHSTGGPLISMLSQRVPNIVGVLAAEHSPFGAICAERDQWGGPIGKIADYDRAQSSGPRRRDPFDELYVRTWRDLARYAGPEALGREGPQALMRLPALMEDVLGAWEAARRRPQFKAEYVITHGVEESLSEAARVASEHAELSADEAECLSEHYIGYTRELTGPEARPVPPFLFAIAKHSRDHSPEVYADVILPAFARMDPPPRVSLTRFGAGGHNYWEPEDGLPLGIAPAVGDLFVRAIDGGFFS